MPSSAVVIPRAKYEFVENLKHNISSFAYCLVLECMKIENHSSFRVFVMFKFVLNLCSVDIELLVHDQHEILHLSIFF